MLPAIQWKVDMHSLTLLSYPFKAAGVQVGQVLQPSDIAAVMLQSSPPELLLKTGEIMFGSAHDGLVLERFAILHNIPLLQREDVWSWLCAPYVDTEFTPEDAARNAQILVQRGFDEHEVAAIRARIGKRMLRNNAVAWEWVSLNFFDVLRWCHDGLAGWMFWLKPSKSREFYAWAQAIAARSTLTDMPRQRTEERDMRVVQQAIDNVAFALKKSSTMDFVARAERLKKIIFEAYAQPHRHHYTLSLVAERLEVVQALVLEDKEKLLLQLAVLFGDVVYAPETKDSKERSVHEAMLFVHESPLSEADKRTLEALMLLPKSLPMQPRTPLEQKMADVALIVFARESKHYQRYILNLRKELTHLDEDEWRMDRLEELHALMAQFNQRGRCFYQLSPLFDQHVVRNVSKEIEHWERMRR